MNHTTSAKKVDVIKGGVYFKDIQQFQSYTEELQKDLFSSHQEISRLSRQLECLILLVKKAWTGDPKSNMHLARIIGAAPPRFETAEDDSSTVMMTVIPQTRAMQNWVLLTVGLLNQDYKRVDQELQEQQNMYLHSRIVFLEDQVSSADDQNKSFAKNKSNPRAVPKSKEAFQSKQHPNTQRETNIHTTPPSRLSQRPLYRNQDQGQTLDQTSNAGWTDIHAETRNNNKTKLFELDVNFEDIKLKKRPVSAIHSKPTTVANKTRPVSAVVKGGRPMKYETTRPISGKPNKISATDQPINPVQLSDTQKKTVKNDDALEKKVEGEKNANKGRRPLSVFEKKVFKQQKEILERQIYDGLEDGEFPLEARMAPAVSVTKFEEDLDHMSEMERQFKRTALELQRRIGIKSNGMV